MAKAEYRSSIRSKKLITAALADLLQEKPLDKVTVSDVVRRAEINRGTFYAHYSDIPDVLNSLIQQIFSTMRDTIFHSAQPLTNIPHALTKQIQFLLEEDTDFCRKIMTSSASSLFRQQLVEIMVDYLLQHEEDFSIISHEEFILRVRFCAGGLSSLYQDWFAGKLPFTLAELTLRAEKLLSSIITDIDINS